MTPETTPRPMGGAAFLEVSTVHQADVSWWWADDRLHDASYHITVNDSIDQKVMELRAKYPGVSEDTRYCSQWEGRLLCGTDLAEVTAAGAELAQHLSRFKGVRPL